jgi:hypothetical protein
MNGRLIQLIFAKAAPRCILYEVYRNVKVIGYTIRSYIGSYPDSRGRLEKESQYAKE